MTTLITKYYYSTTVSDRTNDVSTSRSGGGTPPKMKIAVVLPRRFEKENNGNVSKHFITAATSTVLYCTCATPSSSSALLSPKLSNINDDSNGRLHSPPQ